MKEMLVARKGQVAIPLEYRKNMELERA